VSIAEPRPTGRAFWAVYATVYDAIWDSPMTRSLAVFAAQAVGNGVRVGNGSRAGNDGRAGGDGPVIVDLGCGTGLLSQSLTCIRVGVDSSPAMLRRAVARGRVDHAQEGDAVGTDLLAGSASAVIIGNVLHLHPDPRAVVDEARRLCVPGGCIFLCWPVAGLDTPRMRRLERHAGRPWLSAWTAHALRTVIGVFGAFSPGVEPHQVHLNDVMDPSRDDLLLDAVFAECQHVVVLRRRAGGIV
jgi:SAM-dependent methyltransferase